MNSLTIEYNDVENKLAILYLINAMDLPMSRTQITSFFAEKELLGHMVLMKNLDDLVERGFLGAMVESSQDEISTSYILTDDGNTHLEHLESLLPRQVKRTIDNSIDETRGKIRKGYERTAHYFPNAENDEFTVKCGVYDDKRGTMLMEISVAVVSREQAKHILANWNDNYTGIYQRVLELLTEKIGTTPIGEE